MPIVMWELCMCSSSSYSSTATRVQWSCKHKSQNLQAAQSLMFLLNSEWA